MTFEKEKKQTPLFWICNEGCSELIPIPVVHQLQKQGGGLLLMQGFQTVGHCHCKSERPGFITHFTDKFYLAYCFSKDVL